MTLFQRAFQTLAILFVKAVTKLRLINPQLLLPELQTQQKVYYVLESQRLSYRLLLKILLKQQQRHLSDEQILLADSGGKAPLRETLVDIIDAQRSNPALTTLLIPVAIFHGRLPGREDSWLNMLYAESWHKAGPLGCFFQLLVNGRETLIRVDEALNLQQLVDEDNDDQAVARKTSRVLRTHFNIVRRSIIGPDLSHRRTLINLVLNSPKVQQQIDLQAQERGTSRHRIERHCFKTLDKIAANFSPITARLLNPLFNWVWSKLYNEVRTHNIEVVQSTSKSHQLIYLPCHRSHMDYLLLSWALYREGLPIPHVAAGENLNIPVIGSILKRGGAIFMRRRFQGDKLYSCLYKTYLEQMSHRGHALEYFIEGGRSRTGRLLPAKTGLLSMSIESYRENSNHPIALVPVWIGYDRLVESRSYHKELSGADKKSESFADFFSTLSILREKFGRTYLSFGEPIKLEAATSPENSLKEDVTAIAKEVLQRINQAASVTQSSVLATSLLAGNNQQSLAELSDRSRKLARLLQTLHPDSQPLHPNSPQEWINQAAAMGQLELRQNLVELTPEQAQEMCFYRNNIQHLLVLPGLYLLLVHRLNAARAQSINRIIRSLYPFLQAELFLPADDGSLTTQLKQLREQLLQHNLIQALDNQSWKTTANPLVNTLILSVEPILLRYIIVLKTLVRFDEISHTDLIATSQQVAERIHLEYGYSTPEYKDEKVLKSFIKQLLQAGYAEENDGRIRCLFDTDELFQQAHKIIRPHLLNLIDRSL